MTDQQPEAQLWEHMRDAIEDAVQCWGDPAAVAVDATLSRPHAKLLRLWIATLEAIVRALLTSMAVRLIPALPSPARRAADARTKPAAAPPAAAPPEPAPSAPEDRCADDPTTDAPSRDAQAEDPPAPAEPPAPEDWRVRFVLAPAARRRTRAAKRPRARREPDRLAVARALARRFEALIRVIRDPAPHARRLARRLAADRYLAARTLARPRRDEDQPNVYGDLVEEALALAWSALGAPAPDPG